MQDFLSLFSIYIFIILGFIAKYIFKEKIDEKSLVLISIYFLQPFIILWGFSTKQIDLSVVKAPLIFLLIVLVVFIFSLIISKFFKNKKDRSIFVVTAIIGNTGNLGIPIGLMIFGKESIIYTTFINIINIILVYIIGVFFYSLGSSSIKQSVLNIFKLPALWFIILAIVFNILEVKYPRPIETTLQMGAYATMVIQLFIFGAYLKSVSVNNFDWRFLSILTIFKYLFIPLIAIIILRVFTLDNLVYNVILLEMIVPIAVMNVNLAALYSCKPNKVAFLTFATSVIFLIYLSISIKFLFKF